MKLSTRSRYGLRLMLALAVSETKNPVLLKNIAASENISEKYLSQIMIPLKAKGLVIAFRGAHGGYLLNRASSDIRLIEIIEPLEGDLSLVDCVGNSDICDRSVECVTNDIWDQMSFLLREFLDSVTLADMVKKFRQRKSSMTDSVNYSI